MWRRRPIDQDLDHPTGTVQIDCSMTQRMHGSMDHAVDSLQRRLESGACSKINAGASARRGYSHAVRFKSAYNLGTEQTRASEHHDPHPVRIVVRIPAPYW